MMGERPDLLEDSSEERWLISYADFVTLLFAFFVVMYAVARTNEGELGALSQTLATAFGAPPRTVEPIQVGDPVLAASPYVIDVSDEAGYADTLDGDTEIVAEVEALMERFAGLEGVEMPEVAVDHDWVEISLPAEVLFPSGGAALGADGQPLLEELAVFLAEFDNPVTVEGYTDNVPIESALFPSNWELSAYRASAVARYLEARGVDRERISAVGYGENHPLETNATPEGRARNRRVDVVVARRGDLGRNRNAPAQGSAFAPVRRAEPDRLDESVRTIRKPDGGLLFTVDPDTGTEP